MQQGRRATKSYLQYYVATKRPPMKEGRHARIAKNVSSLCPVTEDDGETEVVARNVSLNPATNTSHNGRPVDIEMNSINVAIETNESLPSKFVAHISHNHRGFWGSYTTHFSCIKGSPKGSLKSGPLRQLHEPLIWVIFFQS